MNVCMKVLTFLGLRTLAALALTVVILLLAACEEDRRDEFKNALHCMNEDGDHTQFIEQVTPLADFEQIRSIDSTITTERHEGWNTHMIVMEFEPMIIIHKPLLTARGILNHTTCDSIVLSIEDTEIATDQEFDAFVERAQADAGQAVE